MILTTLLMLKIKDKYKLKLPKINNLWNNSDKKFHNLESIEIQMSNLGLKLFKCKLNTNSWNKKLDQIFKTLSYNLE